MFEREEGLRNRRKISSYGDEKKMLEGDFYKPEKPASPFYSSKSFIVKIENMTG